MARSASILGSEGESLSIALVDDEPPQPGSSGPGNLQLRVGFESGAFSSSADAWFEAREWQGFLLGLVRVEKERDGTASLHSMSPGEMDLTVAVVKGGRLLVLAGLVGRRSGRHSVALSFSNVEADVGTLNRFLQDLRRLNP